MRQGYVPLTDAAMRLGRSWGQAWRLMLTGQLEGEKNSLGRWEVSEASVNRVIEADRRLSQSLAS